MAEVKGLHKLLVSQSDQLGALSKEIRLNPTKRVRVNKANKMLQLIDEMLATREKIDAIIHDGVGDTIDLEDDFRDEMAKIKEQALIVIKIAGLIDLLHRADAQRVAGNNKAEIKLLLGALRLIKLKNITTAELGFVKLEGSTINKPLTVYYILRRLADAGYEAEKDFFYSASETAEDTNATSNTEQRDTNWALKGKQYFEDEKYGKAIIALTSAIKADAHNALLYYYRAVVYSKMSDKKRVISDLQKAAGLGNIKAAEYLQELS